MIATVYVQCGRQFIPYVLDKNTQTVTNITKHDAGDKNDK